MDKFVCLFHHFQALYLETSSHCGQVKNLPSPLDQSIVKVIVRIFTIFGICAPESRVLDELEGVPGYLSNWKKNNHKPIYPVLCFYFCCFSLHLLVNIFSILYWICFVSYTAKGRKLSFLFVDYKQEMYYANIGKWFPWVFYFDNYFYQ